MAPMDGLEDPFLGILERSTVAQALRDARASLARPSRPITAESRSLFQKAGDDTNCGSRPSTGYTVDQLSFVKDTFNRPPSSSNLSRMSTRSTLRGSETCETIPELEEPEIPGELLEADVCTFGSNGEVVAESHTKAGRRVHKDGAEGASRIRKSSSKSRIKGLKAPKAGPEEFEEYDGGAADDLALRMDVPEEEESEDEIRAAMQEPASPTTPTAVKPRKPEGGGRRRPQPSEKGSKQRSCSTPGEEARKESWAAGLRQVVLELETVGSFCEGGKLPALVERVRGLVDDLCSGRKDHHLDQASRLLRSVLTMMEGKTETLCLARLARSALDLLKLPSVTQDVGVRGSAAAYLNVSKALYKVSKDPANDAIFREDGLFGLLLDVLSSEEQHHTSMDLRVFVVGILKNASNADENQGHLMSKGVVSVIQSLLKPEALVGAAKEVQLVVQLVALLRNIAVSPERQKLLLEKGMVSTLTSISAKYPSNEELQVNVSRVLSKLTENEGASKVFVDDACHLQQMVACLRAHAGAEPLVARLAFSLGNLTAESDDLRRMLMFDCDGLAWLPQLVARYWQEDRKLAQARTSGRAEQPQQPSEAAAGQDHEGVLIKLIRLVANVTINAEIGARLAALASVVDPLLDILGCKRMPESEELVLVATAAMTNLLFYESPANLLQSPENKQLLCRLLRPMLLESYNVEALVEAARALGNLSRHPDARQWISELRIDEVLCILLAHEDRDLVFYACGALVNLVADRSTGSRLCEACSLRTKLAALLRDALEEDSELFLVAIKVLSNLFLDGEEEVVAWPAEEICIVQEGLQRAAGLADAVQSGIDVTGDGNNSMLAADVSQLAENLLALLPSNEAGAK